MVPERRQRRSPEPLVALSLQLQQAGRELGARVLFVSDQDGLLLGASAAGEEAEALAATLPLAPDEAPARIGLPVGQEIPRGEDGRLRRVRTFELQGAELLLGALTREPLTLADQGTLDRVVQGVRRILGGTVPSAAAS